MAQVIKSIGTTGRDYSTITLWEADLDDTIPYDAADDAVGECYNDSAFDEEVVINGGETLGLSSVILTVAAGERHDGTAGTGARNVITSKTVQPTFDLLLDNLELHWLELDDNGKTFSGGKIIRLDDTVGTAANVLSKLILHGLNITSGSPGEGVQDSKDDPGTKSFLNLIIYDISHTSRGMTGLDLVIDRTENILNCTIFDISGNHATEVVLGIGFNDDFPIKIQNTVVCDVVNNGAGSASCYEQASVSSATVSHNLASDTTASGTGSLDSKASSDQFVSITAGSEDLHLKSGADAIDAGTDLGTTPSGVEIDIDGRDRNAEGDTWDMGAHEFVGAAVAAINEHIIETQRALLS